MKKQRCGCSLSVIHIHYMCNNLIVSRQINYLSPCVFQSYCLKVKEMDDEEYSSIVSCHLNSSMSNKDTNETQNVALYTSQRILVLISSKAVNTLLLPPGHGRASVSCQHRQLRVPLGAAVSAGGSSPLCQNEEGRSGEDRTAGSETWSVFILMLLFSRDPHHQK